MLRSGQVCKGTNSYLEHTYITFLDIDVDPTILVPNDSNMIWLGITTNPAIVNRATQEIHTLYPLTGLGDGSESTFTAQYVMSCTWWRVAKYATRPDLLNTFQLVIAWNAQQTYVMFHYARKNYINAVSPVRILIRSCRNSLGVVDSWNLRTSGSEAL